MQMKVPNPPGVEASLRACTALARAILPSIPDMEGANEQTVRHTETFISRVAPEALGVWRLAQRSLVESARLFSGKPLDRMSEEEAARLVASWSHHPVMSKPLSAVAGIYKITHFDRQDTRGSLRTPFPVIQNNEQPRWHQQLCRAEDWPSDEVVECDVVIVGTGAGGAVVGRHLADQGHAVVFVEEGELVQRHEFPRNFVSTIEQLYRNHMTLGNAMMLIPQGRLVGGSTAVNTGTSFRPPRWVQDRWCEELDSDEFSADALEGYFQRVETTLQIEPADLRYVGPVYDVFKRGADSLGWHNDTITRNAPGCRGEGFCDNGCPTDARRSTNIAYLPPAMERGAFLLSGFRAERVLMEGGRAAGLEGIALDRKRQPVLDSSGKPKRLRVVAKKVIMAAGALTTPRMLMRQGLGNQDQLGRHLTLHPSGPVLGMFDEVIRGHDWIPQSIYSHQFLKDGFMLLSAVAEPHMTPPTLPFIGKRLMEILRAHDNLACLGYLLTDTTEGRLRDGPGQSPVITYNLSKRDAANAQRAIARTCELLLAAGAREVYPGTILPLTIRSKADVKRLEQRSLNGSDFLLTSYHPLGTCRMSQDPRQGVVDLDHQVHGVPGLFVVDGSTVRGPLGVNPQVTIMALATRAADKIGPLIDA